MARQHIWATRRVLKSVASLSDSDYYASFAGLFFGSVHATVNHLRCADAVWYARMSHGKSSGFEHLWSSGRFAEVVPGREGAVLKLAAQVEQWVPYVVDLSAGDDALLATFRYVDTSGSWHEAVRAPILDHVFNHGTHHRGQITAALSRFGSPQDYPELDMPLMGDECTLFKPVLDV